METRSLTAWGLPVVIGLARNLMNTLLLNREPINIDIEPTTFDAHSLNPLGGLIGLIFGARV